MANSTRDQHLKAYFSEEIMKQLDEAERNVLYDEFSNSELRLLSQQPIETIKSQAGLHLQKEYERRLTAIKEEEYPMLKSWYVSIAKSVHEVICSDCGALIALEVDTKDESTNGHHLEGKFVVAIGDNLFSYRPRLDGVMGYQCANIVELTDEAKAEISKERDANIASRRKELTKEITERFADDFKTGKENMVVGFIENPDYPKVTNRKQAEKLVSHLVAPGKPEIEKALEINLNNEFPEIEIGDKVYCGNDTRWAQIEIANIPEEHIMTSLTESDIVKVKQEMNATNYEPDVKKTKTGVAVESFELREVKA